MPRVKIKKRKQILDMTAMVDVAFLLLTFLILTAKPKDIDLLPVELPLSTEQPTLADDAIVITIGEEKTTLSIREKSVRELTLEKMAKRYGISFTEAEKTEFINTDTYGLPLNQLSGYLSLPAVQREKYPVAGIPLDSIGNKPSEFYHWIFEARTSAKELHNKDLPVAIKGDGNEKYPYVKNIIDILQSQKINRFSLVTNLETEI